MEAINDRVRSFMKDPVLYRTTVIVKRNEKVETFTAYAYAEGDEIQDAEDMSEAHIAIKHGIDESEIQEVTTEKHQEVPVVITEQDRIEVMDMLWDNYFTLSTNAVEAMAIIWDEYANGTLAESMSENHDMTEDDILDILSSLTQFVKNMPADDRRKSAIRVYAEWNEK